MKSKSLLQDRYNNNIGIIHGYKNNKTHDIFLKLDKYSKIRSMRYKREIILHNENHIIFKLHIKITLDFIQEFLSYRLSIMY